MKSICNFLPPKKCRGEIEVMRYVYETDIHLLKQPFHHATYLLHVVMNGHARLKIGDKKHLLKRGTVFFGFPETRYEITDFDNFTYTYLSFTGEGAEQLVKSEGIDPEHPTVENLTEVADFFHETVGKVNQSNACYLGESALYFAFAKIADERGSSHPIKNNANLFEAVTDYIAKSFSDPNLSLAEISNVCFYSEKHISSLIKKNTGCGFAEYLTKIRISKATEIMKNKSDSITGVALCCGFSDPLYFSKVFKKHVGKSPTAFMKENAKSPLEKFIKKYSIGYED